MNVVALVVTFNRKKLLEECLTAISHQSVSIIDLVVVDNASTDGTSDFIKQFKEYPEVPHISYLALPSNIGGAGGFYEGMKYIKDNKIGDFVWLMDDDTIPDTDCLKELLDSYQLVIAEKPSFIASTVVAENRCIYMNVPDVDTSNNQDGYPSWHKYLNHGLVNISRATFVSLLFPSTVIERCGLPVKDFFIWGDDTEYTKRVIKNYGPAFLCSQSIAIHKRKLTKQISIFNEDNKNRIKMHYYACRNLLVVDRFYNGGKLPFRRFLGEFKRAFKALFLQFGFLRFKIIISGTFDGYFRYHRFHDFIRNQLSGK